MGNNDKFWLEDFKVLFTNFCSFNPLSNKSMVENLNAYTRFLLIVMIVIYALTKELKYIYICLALIVLIVIIYYIFKPSNFANLNNFANSKDRHLNETVSVPKYAQEQLKKIQKQFQLISFLIMCFLTKKLVTIHQRLHLELQEIL